MLVNKFQNKTEKAIEKLNPSYSSSSKEINAIMCFWNISKVGKTKEI